MSSMSSQRPLPPPPPDWQPPPPQRRKGRAGKAIAIILLLLILFAILFYTPIGTMFMSNLFGNGYPASSTFRLTRQIDISIAQGEINYLLDLPRPTLVSFAGGTAQTVTKISTEPQASTVPKYHWEWSEWEGTSDIPVTVTITSWATVNTMIWDIDSENSGMASDMPNVITELMTGNEWETEDENGNPTGEFKIWPTNPTIRNLANSLTSDDFTVYDNVKRIYSYVRENIEYSTVDGSEAKSCLDTLYDGTGDCDDQSILLISLCRSIGIPSWLAFGTLYDSVRNEWGPHAWAEVFMPYAEEGGDAMTIDPANGEFLVRNCNRLEEWKSDGNGSHLADYYSLLSYNYTLSGPHGSAPIVSLSESYSGEYQASKEYACIRLNMENTFLREMASAISQKV